MFALRLGVLIVLAFRFFIASYVIGFSTSAPDFLESFSSYIGFAIQMIPTGHHAIQRYSAAVSVFISTVSSVFGIPI